MSISNDIQQQQRQRGRGKTFRPVHATIPGASPSRLTHDARDFLLDGRPTQIFSGELHYFRVPRPYWRDRLLKAKALGLNTVCTYMPWNLHEPRPGEFDFDGDGGMLDVAGFVRLAQQLGLHVILRPGPYICAEWDFGGLPGWLLADPDCRVRCSDPRYLAAVERYVSRVGQELSALTCGRGGPIIMVQVENEYGSFSNDKAYLARLRDLLRAAGLGEDHGTLLFTSDGPQTNVLATGAVDGCPIVANFGSKAQESLRVLRAVQPDRPLMCGEYWCGWFDQWGKRRSGSADPAGCVQDVRWMAEHGASFNVYMFHGGTNFGFTSGANYYDGYAPTVTGYDYWALLDEAGRPTDKYHAVREILKERRAPGAEPLPDVPASPPVPVVAIDADRFHFTGSTPLLRHLPAAIVDPAVRPMERYGQYGGGAILYRTSVAGLGGGKLTVVDPHDYAVVYLDGRRVGTLDRRLSQRTVELPADAKGRLDVLVWALGRINYGPHMLDRKGITERVELGHFTLSGWEVFPLPMDRGMMASLAYSATDAAGGPTFYRFEFDLGAGEVGDTFLDLRRWHIGAAWVNGHHLGRYWRVGPQQTLYCPGCWLRAGWNELVIFDLEAAGGRQPVAGLREPILDDVPSEPAAVGRP